MPYRTQDILGCRLVFGSIPLTDVASIIQGLDRRAVADSHVARLADANFAFGLPADLRKLEQDPGIRSAAMERARKTAPALDEDALQWLAYGHQGNSSQTLFQHLTGVKLTERPTAPSDPSDLSLCRLLLEQVPGLAARLQEAGTISTAWSRLVANWATLCEVMDSELPQWRTRSGKAPQTGRLMQQLAL